MTKSTMVDYSKSNVKPLSIPRFIGPSLRSSPAGDEEVVFQDFTELSLEVDDGDDGDDDDDDNDEVEDGDDEDVDDDDDDEVKDGYDEESK